MPISWDVYILQACLAELSLRKQSGRQRWRSGERGHTECKAFASGTLANIIALPLSISALLAAKLICWPPTIVLLRLTCHICSLYTETNQHCMWWSAHHARYHDVARSCRRVTRSSGLIIACHLEGHMLIRWLTEHLLWSSSSVYLSNWRVHCFSSQSCPHVLYK